MDRIHIQGGQRLEGTVPISGAKNAALPLMAAALLSDKPLVLSNLPALADIRTMARLLQSHGVAVSPDPTDFTGATDDAVTFHAPEITDTTAHYDLVRKMRASVLVLGPILGRMREARVSLPGGCAIGTRPVNLHLEALEKLGAEIDIEQGYVIARAPKGLIGGHVNFPMVSVGATENILMAACLAKGETVISNAAREPEISDLVRCLTSMGAEIEGIGTDTLRVQGRDLLDGAEHAVVADRIEAGTYAIAAAITGGDLELRGARADMMETALDKLQESGVAVSESNQGIRVSVNGAGTTGIDVITEPYPGFPTDLQAQMMSLMTLSEGAARITETIFENRFMHVPELSRMGADIGVRGSSAFIRGVDKLIGAPVMATDLRASVSLVLAGLAAKGETVVNRVYHLDRGYERLEQKLSACGAVIERQGGSS